MEEKKKSLLNELEKMNPFRKKEKNEPKEEKIKDEIIIREKYDAFTIQDERIIKDTYEVLSNMFWGVFLLLFLMELTCDTLKININGRIISILINLVSYIGLISLCKKNAIEGNKMVFPFFFGGIFTLPCVIFNILDDYIYKNIESILAIVVSLGGFISLSILLYQIANIVYKKNSK